jgi:DNA-binding NarL/FixJ family response regulator
MAARVLVVEDEPLARELLAKGLTRRGYVVDTAADGLEAAKLLDQPFDFVVTDLVMPGADGFAVLEELNRRGHGAQRIIVTSFADKDRVVAVLNLGAHYLLEKPFGVEALAGILKRLESEHAARQSNVVDFFQRRLSGLPLTPRERELVVLLLRGDSNKQIARKLGISEQTVKNTLSHAYATLGVQSRGELFHVVFPV